MMICEPRTKPVDNLFLRGRSTKMAFRGFAKQEVKSLKKR